MEEEATRKIVREEIERAVGPRAWPVQPLPMPKYEYQKPYYPGGPWPVTCSQGLKVPKTPTPEVQIGLQARRRSDDG